MEIGGIWQDWSSLERLDLRLSQPVLGSNRIVIDRNWKDTYGFNIGAKYNMNDTIAISAGYHHENNPVPDDTFDPSIPATDVNGFSFGIHKTYNQFNISAAYVYQKYQERQKNNNVSANTGLTANGKYEQEPHIFALSINCNF